MSGHRKTQRARILSVLFEARGAWVPAPELAREGGLQFQTSIYEIRHRLHLQVENRVETIDGVKHSSYRLVSGLQQEAQTKRSRDVDGLLFGDIYLDRIYAE